MLALRLSGGNQRVQAKQLLFLRSNANFSLSLSIVGTSSYGTRLIASSSSSPPPPAPSRNDDDRYANDKISSQLGHNFPDFIEHWGREPFKKVGYGLSAASVLLVLGPAAWTTGTSLAIHPLTFAPGLVLGAMTFGYWKVGLADIKQTNHAIRRNYPVLGNMRYIMESVRHCELSQLA